MTELLNCSKCGKPANLYHNKFKNNARDTYQVECSERMRRCRLNEITREFYSEEEAIQAWNERQQAKSDK